VADAVQLDAVVLDRQRGLRVAKAPLAAFLRRLARECPPARSSSVTVCLVSDRRMRELNRRFRGIDRSTDVLSFPDDEREPADGEPHLGDLVLSVPTAAEQARRAGHSLARELRILLLHGYLHLLGHDHEVDGGTMMRLQRKLTRRLLPTGAGR
jgi:probable rRNA maturation factor